METQSIDIIDFLRKSERYTYLGFEETTLYDDFVNPFDNQSKQIEYLNKKDSVTI